METVNTFRKLRMSSSNRDLELPDSGRTTALDERRLQSLDGIRWSLVVRNDHFRIVIPNGRGPQPAEFAGRGGGARNLHLRTANDGTLPTTDDKRPTTDPKSEDFHVERSEERRVGKECRSRW